MGRRIGSQNFAETAKLRKIKQDLVSKNQIDPLRPAQYQNKKLCLCNKFGKDNKWDICKDILPSVNNKVLRSPNIGMMNAYHHSQKHVSEKFQ